MRAQFEVKASVKNGVAEVVLVGSLTDQDELPDLSKVDISRVVLDASRLTYMNSGGVDKWIKWTKSIQESRPKVKWVFSNVSSSFIRQASVISGFIPDNSYLSKFNISYYCQSCDALHEIAFDRGVDLGHFNHIQTNDFRWPSVSCPSCHSLMEVDCLLEHYRPLFTKTQPISAINLG